MDQNTLKQIFRLAEDVFGTATDPDQIPPTPEYRAKIDRLHPESTAYRLDENGHVIGFVFVVPTTKAIMDRFLKGEITERAILDLTHPQAVYDALYLCAVYVDPRHRRQGLATAMFRELLSKLPFSRDATLFYWPFTEHGERLAQALEKQTGKRLLKREGRRSSAA